MLHIAIVGGGAAGFFAAIAAKEAAPDASVTIYEKAGCVLAKVAVSGGGRCNLTNSFEGVTDLRQVYPRGHRLMKRLFRVFGPDDARAWFERQGVPLVVQADHCIFPASQDSQSVIDALTGRARRLGVEVVTSCAMRSIALLPDGRLEVSFSDGRVRTFHRVAVTTGGSPRIEGLRPLADLGLELEAPVPSLFTFNIVDADFRSLMGTVVERASVSIPGTKFRASAPLLVTHWGASGPAVLRLSSHAARHLAEQGYRVAMAVNWMGEGTVADVEAALARLLADNHAKQLSSVHPEGLTSRVWLFLLGRAGLPADKRCGEVGRKQLNRLLETLTNDRYAVTGKGSFRDEFVTCGGVALSGVNLNTLESKNVTGLFLAGEVLDVDAVTGGFNLQAAWTTGYVAGRNMTLSATDGAARKQ